MHRPHLAIAPVGRPDPAMEWSLAASAESGTVGVEIDEAMESGAWSGSFRVGTAEVRFLIRDEKVPAEMAKFLTAPWAGFVELPLGPGRTPGPLLVRDSEYQDRFFLKILGEPVQFFEMTLVNEQLRDFVAAVADVADQLA